MNAAQQLVDLANEQLRLAASVDEKKMPRTHAMDVGKAAGIVLAMDTLGIKVEWNPEKKAYKLS